MEIKEVTVTLASLSDIMFDRFIDHSKEKRPADQKLYLGENNIAVLPAENIFTFLFGETPGGCAKTFEGKRGKDYIRIGSGHVHLMPMLIPFTDADGTPLRFEGFDGKRFRIDQSAPRTKMGSLSIKQEVKDRPVLCHPWHLNFKLSIVENNIIDATKLFNWFEKGGLMVALGTWRPRYGRFAVDKWE
jgi:hypothetical protein